MGFGLGRMFAFGRAYLHDCADVEAAFVPSIWIAFAHPLSFGPACKDRADALIPTLFTSLLLLGYAIFHTPRDVLLEPYNHHDQLFPRLPSAYSILITIPDSPTSIHLYHLPLPSPNPLSRIADHFSHFARPHRRQRYPPSKSRQKIRNCQSGR